jgi:TFIIF-interacting CTD phosphatase-like protein
MFQTYDIEDSEAKDSRRRQQPNWFLRFFCCVSAANRPTVTRSPAQSSRNVTTNPNGNTTHTNNNSYSPPPLENRARPVKYPNTKHIAPHNVGRKCLALDLDETLVHSSFQPVPQVSFPNECLSDPLSSYVGTLRHPCYNRWYGSQCLRDQTAWSR